MQVVDGKLQMELRKCHMCDGNGAYFRTERCPNDGQKQRGRPCAVCKTTTKYHNWLQATLRSVCGACDGRGERPETLTDSAPDEIVQGLEFRVIDARHTGMSMLEGLLGAGLYSSVDYGATRDLTDDELLSQVKYGRSIHATQACKIADRDGRLVQYIAIVRRRDGYSVIGVLPEGRPIAA